MTSPHHEVAIAATQYWLEKVVIGENFCPFAKREYERKRIHFQLCTNDSFDEQVVAVLKECQRLLDNSEIETTLIIYAPPSEELSAGNHCIGDFNDFLGVAEHAQALMSEAGLDGELQLATFHPDYCFAGEHQESASNYTNRSPFPILHLIREASIERALKTYKDPESIPDINIARAEALGVEHFTALLKASLQANN
ncbi:DUF1415 domain-containing protein [Alteromonas facilis]|uniref:DUF1415 domain-containing protein n=1 Tax=Alteromonas facilis TaxID=2048004 RepID=UPI001F0BB914|nr:DUF1415 domain-containing protein [Alteromonas facilis]